VIEFLLYQGKDSDLKDSIDQTDLANHDAYFVGPTPEMFNDEHAPDYSFPPRFDVYLDDFSEVESDADNFYDDPFDSKGEKIKESKLLIDELDLPCDFLSYSENDSFISQDFSRDDDLPSPDNEDKDFDPLFYEPIVFKDVPNSMRLLPFSSENKDENEEKVFKPGIYTSEKCLKEKIHTWISCKKEISRNYKRILKDNLSHIDALLDKGDANPEILFERASVLHSLQELDKLESIKVAQKAKIKWAIEGGNSCFIVLIPKAQDAKLVKDFRPITLIGSLYKIIAKILANRLVVVLGDIVDFDKACDSVRWDYLNDVLKKFGFKDRWCSWIHNCLRSSRGSVMVNRSPTCEFQFHKGMFRGISLGSSLQLFHLFYANDAVFIGHWSESNIHTITPVLSCFYRASGLRINMNKSKLMGVFVENNKVEQAITKIGCSILKAPFSYLGSKVGGIMSRIQSWNEVVTKLVDRLSKWKLKTLSIGGRLTLLKAVLGSMPIFHMSLFKVPANVLQRMEAIRCHFFNGVDQNDKKRIWVK
nr:RNA-directed DNA polymerase, eukaryota [Tanacetum cinerariifolium]